MAEVELAKLALKKSQNADVRTFSQKMVHDHEMLANDMAPFLKKAGLQPSTSLDSEHQRLYNKLNAMQGKDFDTGYVHAMDKDHHEDLKDFQSEVNSTKDMELEGSGAERRRGDCGAHEDDRSTLDEDGDEARGA